MALCWLPASGRADPAVPRFEPMPCAFEVPAGAEPKIECGQLVVREDRARPDGRQLRLSVTILRAKREHPEPDPVVYLSGGPGGSEAHSVTRWLDHPLRSHRDLILLNPRGTRHSEPLCPELYREVMHIMARDLAPQADIAQHRAAARDCLDSLRQRGVDPTQYRSAVLVADLDDLRQSLGYERFNLLGMSYGTRLALTALRDAPQSIRSVILASPIGPEMDFYRDLPQSFAAGLDQLTQDCAATPSCGQAVPDLKTELLTLLDELDQQPLVVPVEASEYFPEGRFVLNRQDALMLAGELLSSEALRAILPAFVRALRQRETDFLPALLRILAHGGADLDLGMYYAVQCQEEFPFSAARTGGAPEDPLSLPNIGVIGAIGAVCDDWSLRPPEPRENLPVVSSLPALLLVGERDSRAPPAYGRALTEHLSQATLIEIPGAGHDTLEDPCVGELIASFLQAPTEQPAIACLDQRQAQPPIGAVHVKGGPLRLLGAMRAGEPWHLLWPAVALLVLAVVLVGWPVGWLVRRVRRRKVRATVAPNENRSLGQRGRALARGAAWSVALLSWLFCVGLAAAVVQLFATDRAAVILLGLSASAGALFLLPKALALVTAVGLGGGVLAWRLPEWSLGERLQTVVALLAAVALVVFLIANRLF